MSVAVPSQGISPTTVLLKIIWRLGMKNMPQITIERSAHE